jgi:hypothetical protein
MPADTQDALSAIFLLRSKALASGARYEVPVFLNGKVHAVELRVSGRERVQSGLGEVDAWRVTAASTADADSGLGDGLAIWISTDSRRLPVKLQATLPVGAFILTLTQAAGTAPR